MLMLALAAGTAKLGLNTPVNLLLETSNVMNFPYSWSTKGKPPVSRLLAKDRFCRALDRTLKFPTLMDPVNPLPSKNRFVRLGSDQISLGMDCERNLRG